ncbi:MAG: zinc ABC transporter substrate-binding protein [Burkholderiales bacterium]|nr:zinc ABC transporter substrate-binding protein [Anaerolineae bacterium]
MKRFPYLVIAALIAIFALSFSTTLAQTTLISIVATTGMIGDVAQNIGGDLVTVTTLMGPGVDPHLYRATESDVEAFLNSNIIFYNGLHLEARMVEILEQINAVPVGDALPDDMVRKSLNYDAPDPHIWMDAHRWRYVAQRIRDTYVAYDSANADTYIANADAYLTQLDELNDYAHQQINRIPAEQRVLVTAHDAFFYFGEAYGMDVFAPQGISTESEAGVEDIRRTIDILVERQIPAIFVESSVPPDIVEAIVAGAEDQGHEIAIGGSLFSDAMGEPGTEGGTYIGMIKHNVDTIVTALTGEAAPEVTPEALS